MPAIITSPEEIQRYVSEAVADILRQELPGLVREATQKEYLTPEDVKELTGWSNRTLQNLRDTRQIRFSKHGRKITYPTKEFYEFLAAHHVRPRKASRGDQ